MKRADLIEKLEHQLADGWDLIVIGGGATGSGIALDAVTRGYRTLLLEQSDFGKGTSSRSTKLVHGGVRYLAQGDVLLVLEALRERGRMLRNAPHITADQEFIIPVYSWFDTMLYTLGLKFYDLLAGKLSLGKSYFIGKNETLERLPNLKREGLIGGVVYHDGQFDDSRMILTLIRACFKNGGIALNYFKVNDLIKDDKGKVTGVAAKDAISGKEYKLQSGLVINATGVFADDILRIDTPGAPSIIRPSQGIHIVLDKSFLRSNSAIMIPKTDDGRVLFAIPWYGRVVVGTTDIPREKISLDPVPLEDEIDFILRTARRYLVKSPERGDILSVFAGLRPLASDPKNPLATKEISRRHKIIQSQSGLITVTGGKWTTYRMMAEETLDKAIKSGLLIKSFSVTKNLRLNSIPLNKSSEHLQIYGEQAIEIEKIVEDNRELGIPLIPVLPYSRAEIIWICRNEIPVTIEDVLARRTRALFLDAGASAAIAPEVAGIMAKELGLDDKWQKDQLEAYDNLIKSYF